MKKEITKYHILNENKNIYVKNFWNPPRIALISPFIALRYILKREGGGARWQKSRVPKSPVPTNLPR